MGLTVFSDPFINWVAGAMLLGIIAALALAHDAKAQSRRKAPPRGANHTEIAQAGLTRS